MSTFLQLVQDLARQSGTLAGGTTMASVSGTSGRAEKLVNWVKRAWVDIQLARPDWLWMRGEFESALLVGTLRYTGAGSFGITRFSRFAIDCGTWQPVTLYDPTLGQTDEGEISYIPYDLWRQKYDRRTHDENRPVEYAISPAGELCVGPKPDKAYVIRGEYRKSPQELSANSDTPECPAEHHQVIVHRAMVLMGKSDESPITVQAGDGEYARALNALMRDQLPRPSFCGAVA